MIRYMQHHAIDRQKYDHCVRMDKLGLPYGYSWYLDTVTEGWDALILNDYDAVWPLPVRSKFGIKYFYRPFGVQQLGIFSKEELTDQLKREFVEQMRANCRFADLYLNEEQLVGYKKYPNTISRLNSNYLLNLNTSYREVYHSYNQNTRRNIKKANEHELILFENDSPDALTRLFKQNRGEALELQEPFYRNMEKAMFKCLHMGMGKLWTVYGPGNMLCAGAFFVETDKRSTLLFTSLSDLGKEYKAMFYLLNEYIILGSQKLEVLDFEGSNDKGVARFYAGFGARQVYYQQLKYNGLPFPLKWLKK